MQNINPYHNFTVVFNGWFKKFNVFIHCKLKGKTISGKYVVSRGWRGCLVSLIV